VHLLLVSHVAALRRSEPAALTVAAHTDGLHHRSPHPGPERQRQGRHHLDLTLAVAPRHSSTSRDIADDPRPRGSPARRLATSCGTDNSRPPTRRRQVVGRKFRSGGRVSSHSDPRHRNSSCLLTSPAARPAARCYSRPAPPRSAHRGLAAAPPRAGRNPHRLSRPGGLRPRRLDLPVLAGSVTRRTSCTTAGDLTRSSRRPRSRGHHDSLPRRS
jgi:hypothetical protein